MSSPHFDVIGPDITCYAENRQDIPFDHVEVTLTNIEESPHYFDATNNIKFKHNQVGERVIVEATNNGSSIANYVNATAVFFDGKKIVDTQFDIVCPVNHELEPNASFITEIKSDEPFTDYRIYFHARTSKW